MENLNGPILVGMINHIYLKLQDGPKLIMKKQVLAMVPNSPVRKGSFVGKNAVLMPCFVNIGAYIDSGTMVDTFARAGSCCQIGKNCHISQVRVLVEF